jgi:hypothetical protein
MPIYTIPKYLQLVKAKLLGIFILFLIIFVGIGKTAKAQKATITIDKSDYAPGEIVKITGTGWTQDDAVTLSIANKTKPDLNNTEHYHSWEVVPVNGSFTTSWNVTLDELKTSLELTAKGNLSGFKCQLFFTDDANLVVSGTVQLSDGTKISGATITGYSNSALTAIDATTTSAANGTWTLSFAKDVIRYIVVTPPPGYCPQSVSLGTDPGSISSIGNNEIVLYGGKNGGVSANNVFILSQNLITAPATTTFCATSGSNNNTIIGSDMGAGASYQWKYYTNANDLDNQGSYQNISGANSKDYNPGTISTTVGYLRQVTLGSCTSVSNIVKIFVTPSSLGNTIAASTATSGCGSFYANYINGSYPSGGNNNTFTFQWQSSTDGVNFTNITTGGTNQHYYFPGGGYVTSSTYYRRIAYSGYCSNYSNMVFYNTNGLSSPGPITGSGIICSPVSGVAYSIANVNGATSYTWSYSGTGVTISGTDTNVTANFTPGATSGTLSIVANNSCGTSSSTSLSITVNPNTAISSVTGTSPLCIGSTAKYIANGVVLSGGTGTWSSDNPLVATVDGAGNVTALSAGTCNITYTITGGCGGTKAAQQQLLVGPSPGDPSVFGDNQWNIYAYNGTNSDLSANTYRGYYAEPNLSFDTRSRWLAANTPSAASGYRGCSVDKLMTFVAKRRGFPCGLYSISVGHDDEASLYVNGTLVSSLTGWTYTPVAVSGNYFLDENSTVELRIRNTGAGDSYGELVFNTTPSLTGTPVINSPICPGSGSISGTSESNAEIVVYSGVIQIGTTTANPSGQWSLSVGSLSTSAIITATARANNKCLSNVSSSVSVLPANTVSAASSAPTLCVNTTLTPITHTITGATGISNDGVSGANNLPAGVKASWASNQITISGTPTEIGTFNYSISLTGGCGNVNATGTITVNSSTAITSQSTDGQTQCINGTFTAISVTSSEIGTPLFQWYSNTVAENTGGSLISGATSASYTPLATDAGTLYYYCVVTGTCGKATSAVSGPFVTNDETAITSQSTDSQIQCINATFTAISVTASGTGTPLFQWYSNTVAENIGGSSISGATNASYTPLAATAGTLYYYCVVAGTCGTATSTVSGAFVVNPNLPVSVSIVSSSNPVCQGSNVTFTAIPTNGGSSPFYKWKVNSSNAGTNNPSFTYAPANGDVITCELTSDLSCVVSAMATSNAISMTVVPSPTSLAGSNVSTCASSAVNITAGASAKDYISITWTSSGTGTFTNANSLTLCEYTPSIADVAAGSVILMLTAKGDGNCADAISSKTLTFHPQPTIFNVTGGGFYCSGGSGVSVGLSGSENGVSYQLYKNGNATGSVVSGSGSAINFGDQTAGAYTVKATNSTTSCTQDMAGTVAVTDDDTEKPVISSFPANRTVACSTDLPVVKNIDEFEAAGGSVSDNCTPDPNLIFSASDVLDLNEGCKVTRTYTIADVSGNIATCKQVFTINDVAKPVITCNADLVSSPNTDDCAATLTITAPTAISENCSLVNISPTYSYRLGNDPSATPVTGTGNFTATFPEGNTSISWVITDLCGNTSTPCTQIIHVGFNLTSISYDNGSTETGSGSGVQPMQTSTHEYFVDDKAPEIGYTYDWELFENNGGSPGAKVNSSLYTITNINAAYTKITFTAISTGNYILSVIKTKKETTCKTQAKLPITVQSNSSFDVVLDNLGNQCQAPGAALTTISWNVTFPNIITEPFMFSYSIKLAGIVVATGNVSNITYAGGIPIPGLLAGVQAGKSANSPVVVINYSLYGVSGNDMARTVEVEINATDIYQVSEPNKTNNTDDLKINQVPVISFE